MRILLLADIHIGNIDDTDYTYSVLKNIIDNEIYEKKTDLVVILGDYFHRLFKVNEEYVSLAINVMSYLIRACKRNNTKIRIVYGTESHEMNQYKLFNYHFSSSNVDIKLFDSVGEEEINGKKILYIPEEYIYDKHEYYKDYLYADKHYDYIFGHGVIVEGMPTIVSASQSKNNEKHVPHFKSGELSAVGNLTVFGHYHIYTDIGDNVYYLGSLFRNCFGEETPKGYGIIEDDKLSFVPNDAAYVFKTYEFDTDSPVYHNSEALIDAFNKIKIENENIFDDTAKGKIRLSFKVPADVDPSFKETIRDIMLHDKHIALLLKEESSDIIDSIDEETKSEYDFILDNSLNIVDKMYRYISKQYDDPISMATLKSYLDGVL